MTCVVCEKVARYEVCAPINQLKTLARGMHTYTLIREMTHVTSVTHVTYVT